MSVQKKVSFGSKNSMVETWIIDDSADNRRKCGDVREIGGGFYDDTMTSSGDNMVVSSKSTNHKIPNRHVTIGDSTILIMTPEATPDTPDTDGARVLGSNVRSYSPLPGSTHTGSHSGSSTPLHVANVTRHPPKGSGSPRIHAHPSKEEYYDVLHPEPKDQTREFEDDDDDGDAPAGDHEPEDVYPLVSPDDLLDDPHARYVVDTLTGWPLKRSQSLESRDNPFLPGGDLSREAEDLLRRATIIRDNFYLNEEEKKTLQEQQLLQQKQGKQPRSTKHVQIVDQDGHTYGGSSPPTPAVEERISPQSSNTFAAAPAPHNGADGAQPKENGKAGELTAASPDSGKNAIPDSDGQSLPLGPTGPGSGGLSGGGELQVHDCDKKKRNKCCSVM